MKKILAILSTVISVAYFFALYKMIIIVAKNPVHNFGIIWILPFLISAVDYCIFSVKLFMKNIKLSVTIAVFCVAAVQALLPILFFLCISPLFLLSFLRACDAETLLIFIAPLASLTVPLIAIIKHKKLD